MLQIFTTMFFSAAALAGILIMSEMLIGSWPEMKRALGIRIAMAARPRLAPARIRTARRTRQAVAPPPMRAAA